MKKFLKKLNEEQLGSINVGKVMMLGIAMIFIAIGFIFLPISTTATSDLLAYEYTSNTSITDATYTGYTSMLGITPLLILVGFLFAGVVAGFMGIKAMKGASYSASPSSLMLLGLAIVFVAIGLIIEPVMLDGISSVVHGSGSGISSSFTGYSAIVLISPMLVHVGFLVGAVITGFFGIKGLAKGGG